MRIALFEDAAASDLAPLSTLRPVYELLCGLWSTRERALRALGVTEWAAYCRPWLAEVYRENEPGIPVNDLDFLAAGPTLLINGRWLASTEVLRAIEPGTAGIVDGEIAYVTCDPLARAIFETDDFGRAVQQLARTTRRVAAPGQMLRRPWDLVGANSAQICADVPLLSDGWRTADDFPGLTVLGDPKQVLLGPQVEVDPFVVLDARQGPIVVGSGAMLQAFTRLEGPCAIGRMSQLFRANIRAGTTIGPVCRVGGEIEGAILHAYVNKYHDGFLGHSYVCPWVNLGAITTNSDLKNDYSAVRVPTPQGSVDTGQLKVGCFLGDHTKTAIGSFFNTGSSIGVMCLLLPGGELMPRYVPSFSRVWHGQLDDGLDLNGALITARAAMERRGVELTDAQIQLLRRLHLETASERAHAVARMRPTLPMLH